MMQRRIPIMKHTKLISKLSEKKAFSLTQEIVALSGIGGALVIGGLLVGIGAKLGTTT